MPLVPQAGAIAIRFRRGEPHVLLVRSSKDPTRWIFPKGHIEPGETAAQTAVRELREEAGVAGEVIMPVGKPVRLQSGDETVSVKYFLVRATRRVPRTDQRERCWMPVEDALALLSFPATRTLLRKALPAMDKLAPPGRSKTGVGGFLAGWKLLRAVGQRLSGRLSKSR